MPDGRPGETPISDIVVHGEELFDAATNARVRRLCNGAPAPVVEVLATLIWHWPPVDRANGAYGGVLEPDGFAYVVERLEDCRHATAGGRA
ncbi:MAG: hypothetical protein AB7I79_05630 [Rhizobiaceae bacterium]